MHTLPSFERFSLASRSMSGQHQLLQGSERSMFKVEVDTFEAYLAFDPLRRADLEAFDGLVVSTAPGLSRYFHAGTPAGQPGMRFKMLGYGPFHFIAANGQRVEWPTIGVALQKSYISVYFAAKHTDGAPVTDGFRGRLGESRMGIGNFSFVRFDQLEREAVAELITAVAALPVGS